MKSLKIFSVLCLAVMMVMGVGSAAHAAKSLEVGTDNVLNTGDESARTADLYITLKGGFNDVNGLAFTLLYDKDVFGFVGLAANTISLYDGDTYDPANPPDEVAVASSNIVYMANDKPDEGRVLIAAAAANFLANDTNDVVPFVAQFRVKEGLGNGFYPINVQPTIIGPDTAHDAGYDFPTAIPVAVGLDPAADPTTATAFAVQLPFGGGITVGGGYAISGSVQYEGGTNADGALVRLFRNVGDNYFLNDTTTVSNGQFAFNAKPNGTYKLVVLSTNPGFQRRYISDVITVDGGDVDVGLITLLAYEPIIGKITVNANPIPGVKAKVMDGTTLIGYFPVDADGNFVTAPLDPTKVYTITAVYGSAETPYVAVGGVFNWTLGLGTLSGTISGLSTGQNIMIHIMSASAQLEKVLFKEAASDVAYTFENLLPVDDYIVSVFGDGIPVSYYDGGVHPEGVPDIGDAVPQAVIVDQDTGGVDFTFAGVAGVIAGQITEGGAGVADVPVFALETTTFDIYSTLSVVGGNYTLGVADGTYIVFAYKANGKTFYYNSSGTTQVDTEAEEVTPPKADVDIRLDEPECEISGKVTYRREGGDPMAGILVMAEGPRGSAIDVTDENGDYALTGLYCGDEYEVTIFPDDPYPPQSETVTTSIDGITLNFVIHTGWILSGTVAEEGSPETKIMGAWVYLLDSTDILQGVPAITDINGEFTLADIPTGVYTLVAEHSEYQNEVQENLLIENDILNHEVSMTPGVSISGIVYEPNGTTPLPGVMLIATAVGEGAHYAVTNNQGEYEFEGLVDGKLYFLVVNKHGYLRRVTSTTAPQENFDFTLQQPANRWDFSGTVRETGGDPIVGAYVVVSSASNNFYAATTTIAEGAFAFTDLVEAEDYRIVVIPGGNRPVYIEEDFVLNSDVIGYPIVIPVGTITGTITLSDAATGAVVNVYLLDSATGDYITDVTATDNGDGTYDYTFEGVGAGDFKICAFSSGYGLGWYDGDSFDTATAVQSGDVDINFTLIKQ